MPIRVNAGTSVYGGVFDPGIDAPSGEFFAQVKTGRFQWVVSPAVVDELQDAPERVRQVYEEPLPWAEFIDVSRRPPARTSPSPARDTCRCIVSWNFKHLVHFDKIPLYHGVNLINDFDSISINIPAEVIADET